MISRQNIVALLVAVGTVTASTGGAITQTNPPPKSLEERIDTLDQELRILKRQRELDQEAAEAKAKETPILTAGKDGFSFKSADGSFILKLRGYTQADARFYLDDQTKSFSDTFLLRRVRPIFEGTLYKDFGFRIMPDFGGGTTVLQDAYLDWKHWPEFQVRVGKFKPPVGLERLQSGTDLEFVERAFPTALVPNRDVGLQIGGDLWDGVISYAAGIFNGVVDGGSGDLDNGDGKDVAARLFVQPFKKTEVEPLQGLGFGVAGTWGDQGGSATALNLASYKTPGQNTFFSYITSTNSPGAVFADGQRVRLVPQGYYYWGPFGLLGEYAIAQQQVRRGTSAARLSHEAWQVAASYVVTGEKASYKGVTPKRPLDLKGGWGALELVARWNEFRADPDAFPTFASAASSAQKAQAWSVGANWYLNKNVKLSLDYEETDFKGGAAGGADRADEKVIFTRAQLAF